MLRTVSGVKDGAHASRHCQPKAMWRTSSRRISSISRRTAWLVALWTVDLNTSMRISSAAHTRLAKRSSSTCSSPQSEEHTSELQSRLHIVCRLLLEKKKQKVRTLPAGSVLRE